MGIYVPWLADAARLTGYPVVELAGWRDRGHGGMTSVEGVVLHHTAGPKTGEYPSLAVVRDGRGDLAGPLANYGLGRSGTVYVNAAGTAWHAGPSSWAGFTDLNTRFLGIEAEDDGDGVWTAAQLDAYPRLVAACLYYMRRDSSRACAHRECATPAGRKPDPTGIDMPALRARVAGLLTDPLTRIPLNGGDDMFSDDDRRLLQQVLMDLGWARDQLAAGIGVDKDAPPPTLTPEQIAERAVARRVDVGFARDQLVERLDRIDKALGITTPAAPSGGSSV
jgi:hypothetical protein